MTRMPPKLIVSVFGLDRAALAIAAHQRGLSLKVDDAGGARFYREGRVVGVLAPIKPQRRRRSDKRKARSVAAAGLL